MQEAFKIGDLVQLKSGSPVMTINRLADLDQNKGIECVWFDNTNAGPFYATFLESTLVAEPVYTDED